MPFPCLPAPVPAVPPVLRRAQVAAVATAPRRAAAWAVVGVGMAGVAAARAAYVLSGLAPTVATSATRDAAAVAFVVLGYAVASRGETSRPEADAASGWPVRALARLLAAAGVLALVEWAAAGGSVEAGGAVRSLTAAASGIVLGVAEATFVVLLVLGLRPLVLFRRGRWTVGLWRAALGAGLVASLAWAGSRIDLPPSGPAIAFDAAALVLGLGLVIRQRWVSLLSGRQRLAAAGLALALCAALGGLLALRTVGAGALDVVGDPGRIPASYLLSRSVGGLASLGLGLGTLYTLTAALVLLFGLPAAEPTRADERRAFRSIAGVTGSVLDRAALAAAVADGPVAAGLADAAWVALTDVSRGDLALSVAAAAGPDLAGYVDADALVKAAGAAPLLLGRAEADHRVRARPGRGLGSLGGVPCAAGAGALFAARRTPDAYEADDIAALDAFAAQSALALANADLVAGALDRERLARELALAREVQQRLFPQTLPALPGLDLAADEHPAAAVGGDYSDAIALSDTCAGLIVADVSGKGTAAAVHMAEMKGIFGVGARLTRAPADFLCRAAEALLPSLRRGTFVSAVYAVVDAEAGTVALARAGHCPPVLACDAAHGGARLLRGRGVALGLGSLDLFRRTLDEQTVTLAPGDALLLYTDGLVEARDAAGEEWGYSRLIASADRHRGLAAQALLDAVLADHRAWSATPDVPADDVTLLVMTWQTPA